MGERDEASEAGRYETVIILKTIIRRTGGPRYVAQAGAYRDRYLNPRHNKY